MVAERRRGLGGADHGPGRGGPVDGRRGRTTTSRSPTTSPTGTTRAACSLLDALAAEEIPYALDDDELFVAADDEARVDEIVAAISTPGATLTLGGPASFEAMSELFVAADELSHDPDDGSATAALVAGARAAAASSAPYGMEPAWWDGVVARAGALADLRRVHRPRTRSRSPTWPPRSANELRPSSDRRPAGAALDPASSVSG